MLLRYAQQWMRQTQSQNRKTIQKPSKVHIDVSTETMFVVASE